MRRRSRRRRWFWTAGVAVVLLLGGAAVLVPRVAVTAELIRERLQRVLRVPFEVGDASLDLLGGTLEIRDFSASRAAEPGADRLTIPSVRLGLSRSPFSMGALRTVEIRGLVLDLDLSGRRPLDLAEILSLPGEPAAGWDREPLPAVRIEEATVRLLLPGEDFPSLTVECRRLALTPRRDNPREWTMEGDFHNPVVGSVEVEGIATLAPARLVVSARSEPFSLATASERVGEAAAHLLREHHASGQATAGFWLAYPAPEGREGADAVVRLEVEDLELVPPYFRLPFRGLAGSMDLDLGKGGALRLDLASHADGGFVSTRGTVLPGDPRPILDLEMEARGLAVAEEMRDAMDEEALDDAIVVWDAFQPRGGLADIRLRVETEPHRPRPQVSLDLTVRGTSGSFRGFAGPEGRGPAFPYPLSDVSGVVRVRPDMVVIEEFTASHGETEFAVRGELARVGEERALDVTVRAARLRMEPALREALAAAVPGGEAIYDEYAPRGEADAEVRLLRPPGSDAILPSVTILPRGTSARFEGFPYRVDGLDGRIEITPGLTTFHLTGRSGHCQVEGRGRFAPREQGDGTALELWIAGRNLPFSEELRSSLAHVDPSLDEVWATLSPRGSADFAFTAWRRDPAEELSFDLSSSLRDTAVVHREFPLPVHGLEGTFFVHARQDATRVEIPALRGRTGGGTVLVRGRVVREAEGGIRTEFTNFARSIDLTEELADILDRRGTFSRSLWDVFRPAGKVDVLHSFAEDAPEGALTEQVRVGLAGVSLEPDFLPDRVSALTGDLVIRDGVIHIQDLEGRIGESLVRADSGRVRVEDGTTSVGLLLSARDFPLDDRIARMLRGGARQAWLDRQVNGWVDVHELAVEVEARREGEELESVFSGRFRVHGTRADFGVPVREVEGPITIQEGRFSDRDAGITGLFEGIEFVMEGHRADGLRGGFAATPSWLELGSDVALRLHGGTVRSLEEHPALRYSFEEPNDLSLWLEVDGVALEGLLAASGVERSEYRGKLHCDVRLVVPRSDLLLSRGRIIARVREGHLGSVPIFRAIYSLVRAERRPTFTAGKVDMEITEEGARIREFNLRSPVLLVEGTGTLSFDMYLDLFIRFPNLFPEARNFFIIPFIYEWVANLLVAFRVWGWLRDLRTAPTLPLLESAPRPQPIGPVLPAPRWRPPRDF